MKIRTLTALIAFLCFIPFLVFSDGFLWNIAIALVSGVCTFELLCCTKMLNALGLSIPALIFSVFLPLVSQGSVGVLAYGAMLFAFLLFAIGVFSKNRYHTSQITLVLGLTLYVTCSLTSMVILRRQSVDSFSTGLYLVLLVLIIAWGTDTSAYLCGRLFGTHQLAPVISPKKTLEGSIGSLLITTILCVLYGLIVNAFSFAHANIGLLALTGAVGNLFAQMGDLIASLMKRHYSIKDFGTFFPGHGGFMDRCDSIMGVALLILLFASRPELLPLFTQTL